MGEDIAAVVTVRDPIQTTEASIRDYLSGRLASFRIPAQLLIVDDIPKSLTGKTGRSTLAETFAERLQGGFVAPRNDLEALVASIYAEVLEVPQVGANDNFFALGGDSLRATQVISRVRSLFSVNLPIATLFLKTTVAELAQEIAASVEALDRDSKEAICATLREVRRPLSPYVTAKVDRHDSNSSDDNERRFFAARSYLHTRRQYFHGRVCKRTGGSVRPLTPMNDELPRKTSEKRRYYEARK